MDETRRPVVQAVLDALLRGPPLLQVITGPRQVGKTTAARQIVEAWAGKAHVASADAPLPPGPEWIDAHWQQARRLVGEQPALVVLDEVQKVHGWSEMVKALWDEDRAARRRLEVILLGSSALLLAAGTSESLAGRFFLHRCTHWSYTECKAAFGWDLDRWLYFGGYPGAARLYDDEARWRAYVADSLIETALARDVMAMHRIAKPILLRHLFALAARFPAQILSYNKMLGQLQEAGNTTTLAHYVTLLERAFLLSGLERFSAGRARSRGSSPKLVLWNNALISALDVRPFEAARADPAWWGHLVENAVGAHLLNGLQGPSYEVCYWRERDEEVDYVVRAGPLLWAIEVKSGRPGKLLGLAAFLRRQKRAMPLLVGTGGMPLEEFFARDAADLVRGG